MQKDFSKWNEIKQNSHVCEERVLFKEREVWWCRLGVNIGDEEDGKGEDFNRPVLILRKFNRRIFIGLPLSTVIKEKNPFYHKFSFEEKEQSVIISQIRLLDAKRLQERMGSISKNTFQEIKGNVRKLIL